MAEPRITPPDQAARHEALDTSSSYIVQAPAGSGKTELLTHRYLKLLAQVDEPEEILAITFTRAATAEMRSRILRKLEEARRSPAPHTHDDTVLIDARAALAHSDARGWRLLEQPQRLDIQTIDSLCMRIAHEQPLMARMGGHLQPQEDARPLYELAARRTLANLGGRNVALHSALMHLLRLRDNNLADCERLIAGMLAHRDQWLHRLLLSTDKLSEDDWDEIRLHLEAPFRRAIRRILQDVHRLLMTEPFLADQLMELAHYACSNPNELDIGLLATLKSIPEPSESLVEHWRCLCNLLLKKTSDEWRTRFTKNEGFPPPQRGKQSEEQRNKDNMLFLIQRFSHMPDLLALLSDIRTLPPARYDDDEWQILRDVFTILRYAVAELRVLFAERNTVDFIELGVSALNVLEQEFPTERTLAVSDRIRHLLVDEFQDTSRRQHRLLQMLIRAWNTGDGRTCFLVGDPMQSIYMFRQAEVELFEQVRQRGIVSTDQQHECKPLQLSTNFRSHAGLTEPLNERFEKIFSGTHTAGAAAVSFTHSQAIAPPLSPKSVHVHSQFLQNGSRSKPDTTCADEVREREAREAIEVIQQHLPRIAETASNPESSYTVAVLARARQHLALIAQELRKQDIPYRALELETLAERQEVRDLLSLVRALLHPMDRIAWLAVLRAPWCGLTLSDLHILCGEDEKQFALTPVLQLTEDRLSLLSNDGQLRLRRASAILGQSLEIRYQHASLSVWIERTWHSLGGLLCVDEQQRENVGIFFAMLDEITPDGIACLSEELDHRLNRLFAQPDPRASERFGIQLMTIHKAKGLGFDVVLVPGLERSTGRDRQPLICMLERVSIENGDEDELLVAPIGSKGGERSPLYAWVQTQRRLREDEERKRIFYVACTRARRELHLFGTATVTSQQELRPGSADSLLASAWPAFKDEFSTAFENQQNVLPFPEFAQPAVIDIAAESVPPHPSLALRRLAVDEAWQPTETNVTTAGAVSSSIEQTMLYERPEGSRLQRRTGSIIHALLERLSIYLAHNPDMQSDEVAAVFRPHAEAMLRAAGLPQSSTGSFLSDILQILTETVSDPQGNWVLRAHPEAESEASWTGWIDGALRTLRADRVFRAGAEPLSIGSECLWVVDYKTTQYSGTDLTGFLAQQRRLYEPQLTQYGRALRKIHGEALLLRFALYFPRLGKLEHWS
jgi:ATP-dependent helicase/nuclease subunit A